MQSLLIRLDICAAVDRKPVKSLTECDCYLKIILCVELDCDIVRQMNVTKLRIDEIFIWESLSCYFLVRKVTKKSPL